MSFELKHTITSNKQAIIAYDKTGAYASPDNETGWGAPNLEVANIVRAELIITTPDTLETFTIDVSSSFPTTDVDLEHEILSTALNNRDVIESGVWKTIYEVEDNSGNVYKHNICSLLTADIKCKIEKITSKIDICNLDSDCTAKAIHYDILLENADHAACCGKIEKAQRIIDFLYNQIKCCN